MQTVSNIKLNLRTYKEREKKRKKDKEEKLETDREEEMVNLNHFPNLI